MGGSAFMPVQNFEELLLGLRQCDLGCDVILTLTSRHDDASGWRSLKIVQHSAHNFFTRRVPLVEFVALVKKARNSDHGAQGAH